MNGKAASEMGIFQIQKSYDNGVPGKWIINGWGIRNKCIRGMLARELSLLVRLTKKITQEKLHILFQLHFPPL